MRDEEHTLALSLHVPTLKFTLMLYTQNSFFLLVGFAAWSAHCYTLSRVVIRLLLGSDNMTANKQPLDALAAVRKMMRRGFGVEICLMGYRELLRCGSCFDGILHIHMGFVIRRGACLFDAHVANHRSRIFFLEPKPLCGH